jgi:trimeric autotransporter adhesin
VRRRPLLQLTFSLAILLACSDDTGADRGVARVVVQPEHPSVGVDQTLAMTATAYDEADQPLPEMVARWQVGDAGVATVSTSGVVTGVSVGSTTVSATIDAVAGSTDLTVTEPTAPVASVTVEPAELMVAPGRFGRLVPTLRAFNGEAITGPTITWTTDAPAVASVDGGGVVTAHGQGTATVTAAVQGVSTTATVTVDPLFTIVSLEITPASPSVTVEDTVALDVIAKDAQGDALAGRLVEWSTLSPGFASVSADGVVTGLAAGNATIQAAADGLVAEATVGVLPPLIGSITAPPGQGTAAPR